MLHNIGFKELRDAALLACLSVGSVCIGAAQAATATEGRVYLSTLAGPLYRADYQYDGASSLLVSTPQLIAMLPSGGGVRIGPDNFVYVVSAGKVHRVNPATGAFSTVLALNNANTVSFDPAGGTLWAGWKDTPLSSVPISPLVNGTTHTISGDDVVATMVAFTPSHGAFYTTGGELESGSFGRINMTTFSTQRLLLNAFATGAVYDPFSAHLIVAGLGRARQIAPGNPGTVLSIRDDSGAAGENYLVLQADGRGHLVGTRIGSNARLVMIDYSASGLIGAPDSVMLSVPITGIGSLSGEVAIVTDSIFANGFEAHVP